ncbi:uncharacterized protein LOC130589929 [Beta vulgaris subsp. vulgaris]|uniref:uncharacterized protein LOC130589929 n=1 Tax=Beta vulgaris subsp. vulgaris TaxID=3555 RepID=UPI0025491C64|nr:uncharacterized protein LOC130589929 [Beta vulgaris subsp. vulgaris]
MAEIQGFAKAVSTPGIPEWLIQTFYNGLKHEVRVLLMPHLAVLSWQNSRSAKTLLDDMAANNYSMTGVYLVEPLKREVLAAKVDQLSSRSIAPVCEICEVQGAYQCHFIEERKELPEPTRRVTEQKNTAKEVIELSEEVQGKTGLEEEAKETEKKEPIVTPIAPYKPPVPFPQRLAQAKLEKKKIEENVTVSLTAECSAILQNKLPKKLGDPGSYSIPVKLGDIEIKNALCDLGASVSLMPLSICKKLNMGELKPTRISLQLADRTVKFPLGILEDVPLRVGKFLIPCDFVVMEMEEDANVPIILGRPFLATAEAIIDMKKGKITFEIGDEKMEYTLTNSKASPSMGEIVDIVDVLNEDTPVKSSTPSSMSIERSLAKIQHSVAEIKAEQCIIQKNLSSIFTMLENLNTWMQSPGFLIPSLSPP